MSHYEEFYEAEYKREEENFRKYTKDLADELNAPYEKIEALRRFRKFTDPQIRSLWKVFGNNNAS